MKRFTIVAFVCFALVPPVASDSTAAKKDDTHGATQSAETHGQEGTSSTRRKRSVFHLYNMVTCATGCNPLVYKGYGCYCGFLGSGMVVDGIDKCCKGHDWCYEHSSCFGFDHYLAPYRWKCNGGNPYCLTTRGPLGGVNSCGHQLCECDREFVECLKQYPCPKTKAICMTSPWRYWQNLFMGLTSGSGMHHAHQHSPSPSPPPQLEKYHTSSPPSSSSSAPQEEEYHTTSSPYSSSSSSPPSQSPPQDEEHYTSPSHSSPSTLYQNPSATPSSPSSLYQEPSSSSSPPPLYQDNLPSSSSSYDKSHAPSPPPPPPPPQHNVHPSSVSHHRLSLHISNPFQSQHVTDAHTSHHPNEAF